MSDQINNTSVTTENKEGQMIHMPPFFTAHNIPNCDNIFGKEVVYGEFDLPGVSNPMGHNYVFIVEPGEKPILASEIPNGTRAILTNEQFAEMAQNMAEIAEMKFTGETYELDHGCITGVRLEAAETLYYKTIGVKKSLVPVNSHNSKVPLGFSFVFKIIAKHNQEGKPAREFVFMMDAARFKHFPGIQMKAVYLQQQLERYNEKVEEFVNALKTMGQVEHWTPAECTRELKRYLGRSWAWGKNFKWSEMSASRQKKFRYMETVLMRYANPVGLLAVASLVDGGEHLSGERKSFFSKLINLRVHGSTNYQARTVPYIMENLERWSNGNV